MKKWTDSELEKWIVEVGRAIVDKKSTLGNAALVPLERLIYCVWVADYGMRNAGDLVTATDLYAVFQEEAGSLAHELGMPCTCAAFSLPRKDLELQYFELLSGVVVEIVNKQSDGDGKKTV